MAQALPLVVASGATAQIAAGDTIPPANLGTGGSGQSTWVLCADGVFRLNPGKPSLIVVSGNRNIQAADLNNTLTNTSGGPNITIVTGVGSAGDTIFFHPTASGTQVVIAGTGITLYDGGLSTPAVIASFTVPSQGYAGIHSDGGGVWTRV